MHCPLIYVFECDSFICRLAELRYNSLRQLLSITTESSPRVFHHPINECLEQISSRFLEYHRILNFFSLPILPSLIQVGLYDARMERIDRRILIFQVDGYGLEHSIDSCF
jgi:hypothetical protein